MSYNFAPVVNDPRHAGTDTKGETNPQIPTEDVDVRVQLRKLGHPPTLSGEGNAERRARLEAVLGEQNNTNFESESGSESDEEFYTPGRTDLVEIRTRLLQESVARASVRVARQKAQASIQNFTKVLKHRRNINNGIGNYELTGSYTMQGNQRMLSRVRYNSTEEQVACSSWEGTFQVMQKDSSGFYKETLRLAPGCHSEMATLAYSPTDAHVLVTGGAEGKINIWNTGEATTNLLPRVAVNAAHSQRIAQVSFHPMGDFFASSSYDMTWKLWDVNRPEQEILEQEGHAKEVYLIAFHPDGGLLATGGLDAIGLLWDLRSGRKIASLQDHAKGIYCMDFAPNGYHLATGSGDNSVKIWDLRKGANDNTPLFSIPAHSRIVSDVQFLLGTQKAASALSQPVTDENGGAEECLPVSGTCLVTSSYDSSVKVWSADNWVHVKTLAGHTDRVLSCAIRSDGEEILSCGWDRTLRTWGVSQV